MNLPSPAMPLSHDMDRGLIISSELNTPIETTETLYQQTYAVEGADGPIESSLLDKTPSPTNGLSHQQEPHMATSKSQVETSRRTPLHAGCYCSTPVLKAQACWNTSPIIVLHYSLFQAAFSDTVTSASAPPNSSRFKNDAGIFYRFYCESRANRESCHHSVFPFQRQMNALLPRDQATLPKACLGSLLGPMFARRVLLLALWPLGKLEATLLETSDNRIHTGSFSIMRPAPPHFLPPPMSPCQHRKRRLGLAVPPSKTFARPTSTRSISILCLSLDCTCRIVVTWLVQALEKSVHSKELFLCTWWLEQTHKPLEETGRRPQTGHHYIAIIKSIYKTLRKRLSNTTSSQPWHVPSPRPVRCQVRLLEHRSHRFCWEPSHVLQQGDTRIHASTFALKQNYTCCCHANTAKT